MRFLLKVNLMFVLLLVFIFVLASCGTDDEAATPTDTSSVNSEPMPVIPGQDDNASGSMSVDDIFGSSSESSSSQGESSGSSSESSSSESSSSSSEPTGSSEVSSPSTPSGGIDYNDPNIWTDPV